MSIRIYAILEIYDSEIPLRHGQPADVRLKQDRAMPIISAEGLPGMPKNITQTPFITMARGYATATLMFCGALPCIAIGLSLAGVAVIFLRSTRSHLMRNSYSIAMAAFAQSSLKKTNLWINPQRPAPCDCPAKWKPRMSADGKKPVAVGLWAISFWPRGADREGLKILI
jgi:hypothetical protein